MNTNAIKHILKIHGSIKKEAKKGQIAINIDDFENIPIFISNAHLIEYIGKNALNQDVFKYTTKAERSIIVIESVIINKRGNKVYIETMYKKEKSNSKKLKLLFK